MRTCSAKTLERRVSRALIRYVRDVGATGDEAYSTLAGSGPIAELEERLRRHYGKQYAVCVSSATTGLLAVGVALGLERSEVIVPPVSYGATLAPFLHLGCKAVFADIEADTLCLDPEAVRRRVGPDTRALVAVDAFGTPSNTGALRDVADCAGIRYIADAAASLGGSRDRMPASHLADALVVSFGVGKSVFCGGEGGAVVTDDADLFRAVVSFTQHPSRQARDVGLRTTTELGLNGRMHGLAAAWANAAYDEALRELAGYRAVCFEVLDALDHVGWVKRVDYRARDILPTFFRLTATWKGPAKATELVAYLAGHGHDVTVGPIPYGLLYKQPAFRARLEDGAWSADCPIAERELRRRFCIQIRRPRSTEQGAKP
jgi:perosamine synthetase